MKKILSLVLVLLIVFSFTACKNSEDTVNNENDAEEIVSNKSDKDTASNEDEVDADDNGDNSQTETENPEAENNDVAEPDKNETDKTDKTEQQQKPQDNPEQKPEQKPEEKPETDTNKTLGNQLLAEFKKIAGSGNAYAVAEKLAAYPALSVLPMGAMEIEPGYLAGFDNTEIAGFKEGAMFAPMMGTIPFVGYVFNLEDGADVSAFISKLTSSANLRWNICTTAEEMVTGSSGKKVFFVMCNESLEE